MMNEYSAKNIEFARDVDDFISEKCVKRGQIRASNLYMHYKNWALDNKKRVASQAIFGAIVGSKFPRIKKGKIYYEEISLPD